MPNRLLREGFLDDELVSALSDGAETLFTRLLLVADDYGRFDGRPGFILAKCYPLLVCDGELAKVGKRDVSVKAISARLRELARKDEAGRSLVTLYRAKGKPYLELHNFRQRLRQMHSKWPAPPEVPEPEPEPVLPIPADPTPGPGDNPPTEPPPPPVLTSRARAQAIAARAIDYLNEKAGTKFRHLDGTLKLPIARILEGATEADLIAVIDLKLAQAVKGEFERKYLRPATLFNSEKFSNYIGQVAIKPPGPAAPAPKVTVEAWVDDIEKRITITEFDDNGTTKADAVAKRVAKEYARMISGRGLRTLRVSVPGQDAAVFSIEELTP